jgi:hypothetical protein
MAGGGYQFQKFVEQARRFKRRACVLSIGDSWFQYALRPFPDLQRRIELDLISKVLMLDNSYPGRDAKNLVEDVISQTTSWAAYMQQQLRPFKAMLVSLGGNDVIGKDFSQHLKHAADPLDAHAGNWPDAPAVARRHIRFSALEQTFERIRQAYGALIKLRNDTAPGATIFCHSYADVTPCNVRYEFFGIQAGPWLWTPMLTFGITDPAEQRALARWLLASFADLLKDVAKRNNMVVLDTRLEIPDFDGWWDNEIHPSKRGFEYLARNFWVPEIKQAL